MQRIATEVRLWVVGGALAAVVVTWDHCADAVVLLLAILFLHMIEARRGAETSVDRVAVNMIEESFSKVWSRFEDRKQKEGGFEQTMSGVTSELFVRKTKRKKRDREEESSLEEPLVVFVHATFGLAVSGSSRMKGRRAHIHIEILTLSLNDVMSLGGATIYFLPMFLHCCLLQICRRRGSSL